MLEFSDLPKGGILSGDTYIAEREYSPQEGVVLVERTTFWKVDSKNWEVASEETLRVFHVTMRKECALRIPSTSVEAAIEFAILNEENLPFDLSFFDEKGAEYV